MFPKKLYPHIESIQQYRFFIITFSINTSTFFSHKKTYPFENAEDKKSATWDSMILSWKCSGSITPNLFNSVTSNDFKPMKTSVFSLKLCKKEKGITRICVFAVIISTEQIQVTWELVRVIFIWPGFLLVVLPSKSNLCQNRFW